MTLIKIARIIECSRVEAVEVFPDVFSSDTTTDEAARRTLHYHAQQNDVIRNRGRSDIKGAAYQSAPSSAGSSADDQFLGVPVFLFKERGRLPRRAGRQTRGAEP